MKPGAWRVLRAMGLTGLACGAMAAAATQYDCVDERGAHHRMPGRIDTELIHFECTETADTATTQRAVEVRRYSSVMLTTSEAEAALPPIDWPTGLQARHAPAEMPASGALDALIHAVARQFGHDPDLLRAIVKVESGFNAKAVSPKGAVGLMQLMPATAKRFGVSDSSTLTTPGVNLQAGARYLAYLKQLFPRNLELAIAAYNAGEGAVIQRNNHIPPFPETQSYVQQVLEAYRGFRARRGPASG